MARIRINKRKEYKEQLRMFVSLSNRVRNQIREFFKKYSNRASREYIRNSKLSDNYYSDYYNDLLEILSRSSERIIEDVDIRLKRQRMTKQNEETDPIIKTYIAQFTAENVRNISATTRKTIQKEIELGIEAGLQISTIASNIKKSGAFKPIRATLIARTESHQAMNYGNTEVAKRLGLKKPVKEWASALDERTRSWHRVMNGTRVDIDKDFTVQTPLKGGGVIDKPMSYPGDAKGGASNVINCRCFLLYYDSDDIVD